jgi:hypothetical protein
MLPGPRAGLRAGRMLPGRRAWLRAGRMLPGRRPWLRVAPDGRAVSGGAVSAPGGLG